MEWLWFVKDSDLIPRLTGDEVRRLELRSRARSFAKDSPIPLPADPAVFLVTDGRVRIDVEVDRSRTTETVLEPGDLVGVLPGCAALHDSEQLRADLPVTLVMIPQDAFCNLLDRLPTATIRLKKRMGLRRIAIEMPMRELIFRTPRQRLAKLLLSMSGDAQSMPAHEVTIAPQLSAKHMAKLIGTTVESVKCGIEQLKADDLVDVRQGEIVLVDPRRLAFLFLNSLAGGRRMSRLRVVS